MKVVFGNLEEMLSEIKEKEIRDIRVEALYDEGYSKEGIPFLKVYVTVQALMPQYLHGPHEKITAYLYACYKRVTFKGIKPFSKGEMKSIFDKNLEVEEEVKSHLVESGFIVRAGHFSEDWED